MDTVLSAPFRRCQVTGLDVCRDAERLIKVNAVTAVLFLALGGVMALLIALTRWQVVHLLPMERFYELVGAHGATMLVFWILFFEVAGLIFGSTVLLNHRMVLPRIAWVAYGMMLGGALLAEYTMLTGRATVMFTSYPPLKATPWYYAGVLVFAVGALIAVVHFLINVEVARRRRTVQTLPLFTFGLVGAAILALFTILAGAAALVPVFLWSIGLLDSVDPGVYRLLFWGFGHGAQQVNLAAMVAIWYGLASITVGAKPLNEGLSRFAFVLYILFIQMGSMHHLMVDPGIGTWARGMNTSYFVYAAVLGSMIHAFTIPASVEVAQRTNGFSRGLFGWLRHAPWGSPGFSAMVLSMLLFGVMGGISGVIMGGMQVNMIAHNTLIVPAHFHMTVVAGTTLAFMGIAYYLVPLIFQRDLVFPSWAKLQPYLFATGMALFGLGMGYAGHMGAPRRHWDITFSSVANGPDVFQLTQIEIGLAVMALGAVLAVAGGTMFVVNVAATAFLGRRTAMPRLGQVSPDAFSQPMPAPAVLPVMGGSGEGEAGATAHHGYFEAPGTLVIAGIWFALFIILYGVSYLELSHLSWLIH